jgi:hypothetical protein
MEGHAMHTTPANMVIAETILEQLGGRRFRVMTGARDFVGDEEHGCGYLRFRLPARMAKDGANLVKVTLTAMDDYIVETFAVRGSTVKALGFRQGVYCDTLRAVFTTLTGLDTRL